MAHEHSAAGSRTSLSGSSNPVLVQVTRGTLVESRHRGSIAVVASDGTVLQAIGDIHRRVFPRSAIKPLQALALVETGAADAFGLGVAELALACASHNGEPRHTDLVGNWLARIDLSEADLECGAHLPYHEESAHQIIAEHRKPTQLHNNCSGKHTGFLTVARHLGFPITGYIRHEHPVQQRILGVLEQMCGLDLGAAPRGIDGCGIPTLGVPLGNLALGMARLADPHDQPDHRQAACARIVEAMMAEPFMVAGTDRFCTQAMEALAGRAVIKTGAEGVYCGALPDRGIGIALKIDDGAGRAAEVAMGHVLERLEVLDADEVAMLRDLLRPAVYNRAGREVGRISPGLGWPA